MAEYLSPGVYIEEVEMGAKPIEGVSTSTVGFVGKGFNIKTFKSSIIDDLVTYDALSTEVTNLNTFKTKIIGLLSDGTKTLKVKISELRVSLDVLRPSIETKASVSPETEISIENENEILKYLLEIENYITKAEKLLEIMNKPFFVSSWADYKNKTAMASFSGDVANEGYLSPAVYSFFANGGKRAYVVVTEDTSESNIIGTITNDVRSGLTCFEEIDDISIICAPGITDVSTQKKILAHCTDMKDRFAIFDSSEGDTFASIQTKKETLVDDSGFGALYYPWIEMSVETQVSENKITMENMFIPPSAAVAGIYARSDNEKGVHKAPANETVRGALSLKVNITKGEQDILNPKNINCIRAMKGMGIRVWGARTISADPLWKYINVRRLFLYLEESIEESTQWVVFEANNQQLWKRVEQTINNFLLGVWKSGALMGNSPEEAYFVKCDADTNTSASIAEGKIIIEIGVAPTKPAEFVIFRIGQLTASSNS